MVDTQHPAPNNFPRYWRYPAVVLGCLQDKAITIILCPGVGLADGGSQADLPIHMVPVDLRVPNSEFDVLLDRDTGSFTKILRKGESYTETD